MPAKSDQANVEGNLRHRHIQLLGSRIPLRDTVSLQMSWEQTSPVNVTAS